MFGKFGDMLGKLGEIKQKIQEIKSRMEAASIEINGASEDIKMTISGNRRIQKLDIAAALQHSSKEELEKHLIDTFNKAVAEADKMNEAELKKVAGGFLPPGIL